MGCGTSADKSKPIAVRTSQTEFTVKVLNPETKEIEEYTCDMETTYVLLQTLMNVLAFSPSTEVQLKANFISVYDEHKKGFNYFVQQLSGVGMENEEEPYKGRIWVLYLNKQRKDWNEACYEDCLVQASDEILWKYEKLDTTEHTNPQTINGTSLNVSY